MNHEHLSLLVTRTMPYGKYKGQLIADLPGHYLGWFAREGFPASELGRLIALMYELGPVDTKMLAAKSCIFSKGKARRKIWMQA